LARIESAPGVPGGVWFWGAADNLRLAATNAVRIAEELRARSLAQ
jgi:aspartate-semialdehyde dehydrogenase